MCVYVLTGSRLFCFWPTRQCVQSRGEKGVLGTFSCWLTLTQTVMAQPLLSSPAVRPRSSGVTSVLSWFACPQVERISLALYFRATEAPGVFGFRAERSGASLWGAAGNPAALRPHVGSTRAACDPLFCAWVSTWDFPLNTGPPSSPPPHTEKPLPRGVSVGRPGATLQPEAIDFLNAPAGGGTEIKRRVNGALPLGAPSP